MARFPGQVGEPPHGVCARPPELAEPFQAEVMQACGLPPWRPTAGAELEECKTIVEFSQESLAHCLLHCDALTDVARNLEKDEQGRFRGHSYMPGISMCNTVEMVGRAV